MAVQPRPQAAAAPGPPHRTPPSASFELVGPARAERIGGLQRIKRRRGLTQHADCLGDQQRVEIFRPSAPPHRAPPPPGPPQSSAPEDLPHREVERQRMTLRPHLPGQRAPRHPTSPAAASRCGAGSPPPSGCPWCPRCRSGRRCPRAPAPATPCWAGSPGAGSSTSMTVRSCPASRWANSGGGDHRHRRGIAEHEPDPRRRAPAGSIGT